LDKTDHVRPRTFAVFQRESRQDPQVENCKSIQKVIFSAWVIIAVDCVLGIDRSGLQFFELCATRWAIPGNAAHSIPSSAKINESF